MISVTIVNRFLITSIDLLHLSQNSLRMVFRTVLLVESECSKNPILDISYPLVS